MYYSDLTIESIIREVQSLNVKENEAVMFLFGEESKINYNKLIDGLNGINVSFFGAFFPSIIYANKNYKEGYIVKKLPIAGKVHIVENIQTDQINLPDFSKEINDAENKLTVLTLVDGFTGNITFYLNEMFDLLGNTVNFLGAGAGSVSFIQKPCVFSNDGIFENAACLCLVDMQSSLSVRHGWSKLVGPFVATRTEKNIIYELNWNNAFEVYKDAIEENTGKEIRLDNFFDVAKGHPFGIFKDSGEDIVRDPLEVDADGNLICIGDVPENTVLYILKGENEDLIHSAETAIRESAGVVDAPIQHTFVVDCISRTLFMEKEFSKELEAINDFVDVKEHASATPIGVVSLGEISSSGDGFLEFYNKTLVIGSLFN